MLPRSLATALLVLLAAPSAQAQTWRITDLGTLGGSHSCANAINNKGDIVGTSSLKDMKTERAVLWTKSGMVELGAIDGFPAADAIGISDAGTIVGEVWLPYGKANDKRAVTWNARTAEVLGFARPDKPGGAAYDVSDGGLTVGSAYLDDPGTRSGMRATVMERGKVTIVPAFDLPDHAGTMTPELSFAVNRAGTVVGAARAMIGGQPLRRPFVYANGVASDPLWDFDRTNRLWITDLNEAGDFAAQRVLPAPAGQAPEKGTWQSLIVKAGKVTVVTPPDGYANSALRAINAKGEAVGYCWNETGGTQPMIVLDGRAVDPNKALAEASEWTIVILTDVNDAGVAVGLGRKEGITHAVRLDPVGDRADAAVALNDMIGTPVIWTTAFLGARPNPARVSTGAQFAFTLAQKADIAIVLTNVQGRRVRTLEGTFDVGPSTLAWDGRDDRGATVSSGVYFASFTGLGTRDTRKVVIAE